MFLISDVIGCIQRVCVVFQEKASQAVFDFTSSLSTKLYVAVRACLLQVLMCILVCVPKKGQGSVYRCHMHTHIHTHTKQWQLGSSYQGDRSMQLGPSASVMCLFTSVQKAWLLLSSQTEPPHHHQHHLHLYNHPPSLQFCLFIIDRGGCLHSQRG